MNIKRELLSNLHRTIVIFRINVKPKIENIKNVLSKLKLLIQDSTVNHFVLSHLYLLDMGIAL